MSSLDQNQKTVDCRLVIRTLRYLTTNNQPRNRDPKKMVEISIKRRIPV